MAGTEKGPTEVVSRATERALGERVNVKEVVAWIRKTPPDLKHYSLDSTML